MLAFIFVLCFFIYLGFLFLSDGEKYAKLVFIFVLVGQFAFMKSGFSLSGSIFSLFFIFCLSFGWHLIFNVFKRSILIKSTFFIFISWWLYLLLGNLRSSELFIEQVSYTKFYFIGPVIFATIFYHRWIAHSLSLNRFLLILTFSWVLIGYAQFFFSSIRDFFIMDLTAFGWSEGIIDNSKKINGTLLSPANFGNIAALMFVFSFNNILTKRTNAGWVSYVIVFLLAGAIVLTGVRTSVFSMIFGFIALVVLERNGKYLTLSALMGLLFFYLYSIISDYGNSYSDSEGFDNPLGRIAQAIALFNNDESLDVSTLKLTNWAFDEFFLNPIFGTRDGMDWLKEYSITDAYLLYHLVQFGLVGVILILSPYIILLYLCFNRRSRNFNVLFVMFLVMLIQTFTDMGLFYNVSLTLYWSYAATLLKSEFQFKGLGSL